MRRQLGVLVLAGAAFIAGAAVAQQGILVDPWAGHVSRAPPSPFDTVAAVGPKAATHAQSPGRVALSPRPVASVPVQPWSPPVVVEIVDPWAGRRVAGAPAAAARESGWAKPFPDIVDPWAEPRNAEPSVVRWPRRQTIY